MSSSPHSTNQDSPNHELLDELLAEYVPEESTVLRPVVLRSIAEQRRVAFRSLLVRTWVDAALHRIERLLLVAVLVVFGYWVLDGYVRDSLYTLQQRHGLMMPSSSSLAHIPRGAAVISEAAITDAAGSIGPDRTIGLPFVDPEAVPRSVPDYLAPQPALAAPAVSADLRPQRLVIPTIQVDTPVTEVFVHDGAWQVAEYAAGYHHGTALPGEPGNTVMAGHAGMRGSVFRGLGQLQGGDAVLVEAGGWRYTYRVRAVASVWPTQVEVMDPTPTPVLTLITCTAWDTKRLIVVADLEASHPLT